MWRILRWVLFAAHNLTIAELEAALCQELRTSQWLDLEGDIQALCGSLVVIHGKEISIVHQTARTYLEGQADNGALLTIGIHFSPGAAHGDLAATCIRYLLEAGLLRQIEQQVSTGFWTIDAANSTAYHAQLHIVVHTATSRILDSYLEDFPLLRYAITQCWSHVRKAELMASLRDLLGLLLDVPEHRDCMMRLLYFARSRKTVDIPVGGSALHLASYFDIPWLVQKYIDDDSQAVHYSSGPQGDTPLCWGSEMGSLDSVKLLLRAGSDVNAFEYDGWSALHWAARNGHTAIVKLLVERGASTTQQDSRGRTAADWAYHKENMDSLRLLQSSEGYEAVPILSLNKQVVGSMFERASSYHDFRDF